MTTTLPMIEAIELRAKEIYEGCGRDRARSVEEFREYIIASDEVVKLALIDEFAGEIASELMKYVSQEFGCQQSGVQATIEAGSRSGEGLGASDTRNTYCPPRTQPRPTPNPSIITRDTIKHLGGVMSSFLLDSYKTMDGSKSVGDCTPEELRSEAVKGKTHGKFCELLAHGVPDGMPVRRCKDDDAAQKAMKLARQFAVE